MRPRRTPALLALLLLCGGRTLAAGAPDAPGDDDPMAAVAAAFAAGEPIPAAALKGPSLEVYTRVKDTAAGCAAPCDTPREVERYKKAVALAAKLLGVDDPAAKYCRAQAPAPGRSPCRLRPAVAATAPVAPVARVKAPAAALAVPAPRGLDDASQQAVVDKFSREAKALDGAQAQDLPIGGKAAAAKAATRDDRAQLPDIRALLDKAEPFAALVARPPLSLSPADWDLVAQALPDIQAALTELDALFRDSADPEAKTAAGAADAPSKKFLADYRALKARKEALAKSVTAFEPDQKAAKLPAIKEGSLAVSRELAAYARSGRLEDLQAALKDLDGFFDNVGLRGPAKAAALKDFQEQAAAGRLRVEDSEGGPRLSFATAVKPGTGGAPAAPDAAPPQAERSRLRLAGLAAAAELPGVPAPLREKARRDYFAAMDAQISESRVEASEAFLDAWSAREPKFQALSRGLAQGDPRARLRDADFQIERFLRKHPDAKAAADPALAGSLKEYARSRQEAAEFYRSWLGSGAAPAGRKFYESELTPFRDTELDAVAVDDYGKRRGLRQYREDGSSLYASDDGALQQSTGKTADAYRKHLKSLGIAWNDLGGSFEERVELAGGKPARRVITLKTSAGKESLVVEDLYGPDGKLKRRVTVDRDEQLTKTLDADGTVSLVSDKKGSPWKRQDGAVDAAGQFQAKTIVNARGLTLTVKAGPDGQAQAFYEPVPGVRGIVGPDLSVTAFDVDASILGKETGAPRQKSVRQTTDLVARVLGWPDSRAAALATFLGYRMQNFCSSTGGCYDDAHLSVTAAGEVSLASQMAAFQGSFKASTTRGKSEEALVYQYIVKPTMDGQWQRGKGSFQDEDFGDGQHYEVSEMVGDVDADKDGTLNEEKGAVALLVYELKDGKWQVVRGEKKGEYTIYKRPSRWANAAEKMGNMPVLRQALDIGKSAVNGVEGGILWAGAGLTEIWDHDRSMQLRAHAWASWGDVGIKGVIEPSKDAARELAEEDARKGLGDENFDAKLVENHKKSVSWSGDDATYKLKYGDAALRDQDVKNAVLDGMSAEHAADYYMNKCHDGSGVWCGVGVVVNVGKSMLEMPVMAGGLAGLELKTAAWAARGARVFGATADTAAAVYDTTRFGFTAANTAQMALPVAADVVQAVDACRNGRSDECKDHISGIAAAAGSLGAFKFVYGKGLGEFNQKYGAKDASWLADTALADYKAGKLALEPATAKILESVSAGVKPVKIEGVPAKYADNPTGLVADAAMGKIAFVDAGGKIVAIKGPAAAGKAAPSAPKADALFKSPQEMAARFGGDPYAIAEKSGIRIGGQSGSNAKLIEVNGEQWVVKSRRLDDARARSAARNELLTRELVKRFFSDQFDTTEGYAYEDGERVVTVNKYDETAKADRSKFLSLTEAQRASLSALSEVFGLGDINHGNILFGKGKPVLIDFESLDRDSPIDRRGYEHGIVQRIVDWGHAPFVDRAAYNDPAVYQAEFAKWRQRFQDPGFQAQLDSAFEKAGLGPDEAAAYKKTLAANLAKYEDNMGAYLDVVNARHPKPQAPAADATNPGKAGARKKAPPPDAAPAVAAAPTAAETPLEADYHDFSLEKYGAARGRDFVVVEDLEPGATLKVRRSRAHPEDTEEVRRDLATMGFKTELDGEFVEDHLAKKKRFAAYDRAHRMTLDGLSGADFMAGGDFSAGDGGTVRIRGSRANPKAAQAVKAALEAGGYHVEVVKGDFVEDHRGAPEPEQAPADPDEAVAGSAHEAERGGTAVLKKPKKPAPAAAAAEVAEAVPAPEGDGGHGENGSVEEARRAKQLDIFVVDPAGRVTMRPDGVIDLPSKGRYSLVQRNKRTGAFQVLQGDARALDRVKAFLAGQRLAKPR